jgi:hypothetical protein
MKRHNPQLQSSHLDQTRVFLKSTSGEALRAGQPSCLTSWKLWAARAFPVLCIMGAWCSPCSAQGAKPEIGKVMSEIYRLSEQDEKATAVMWFPLELWEAEFQSKTDLTPRQRQALAKMFEQYLVVGVCRFEVGPLDAYKYDAEKEIRDDLLLIDGTGTSYRPLDPDKISSDFQNFLAHVKPILAINMGKMGKNFNLYVFPGKSNRGQLFGRASQEGRFAIQVADSKFNWRLPLASMVPEKSCAKCGKKLSGAFNFCPYDATMLAQLSSN